MVVVVVVANTVATNATTSTSTTSTTIGTTPTLERTIIQLSQPFDTQLSNGELVLLCVAGFEFLVGTG